MWHRDTVALLSWSRRIFINATLAKYQPSPTSTAISAEERKSSYAQELQVAQHYHNVFAYKIKPSIIQSKVIFRLLHPASSSRNDMIFPLPSPPPPRSCCHAGGQPYQAQQARDGRDSTGKEKEGGQGANVNHRSRRISVIVRLPSSIISESG